MFFARKKRQAALCSAIDEMGAVREKMRQLKLREAELREEIESYRPNAYVQARRYELQMRTRSKLRLNVSALPEHIREDKRYWKHVRYDTMMFTPLDSSQMEAGEDEVDDKYADLPIPELLPGSAEAEYGRRMHPDPQPAMPLRREDADLEDILRTAQAAEDAMPFDWSSAPGGGGMPEPADQRARNRR